MSWDVGDSQAPARPPSWYFRASRERLGTAGDSVTTRRPDSALRVPSCTILVQSSAREDGEDLVSSLKLPARLLFVYLVL